MNKIIHTFVVLAYKESIYLEECIRSVMKQSYHSKVVIATTTDNAYIRSIAKKYKLDVIVGKHTSIGGDFDFAVNCGKTKLVTVAHQDDLYDFDYSKRVVDMYYKYSDSSIIFTDYYEVRGNDKIYTNINLRIKKILLFPLRFSCFGKYKFWKRLIIRFGNSICCPAVTFIKDNCPDVIFDCKYKCNVDWFAWEKLSRINKRFVYISDRLMGHRISESSTTTDIIREGIRTKEDYDMYIKFWPRWIARILTNVYKNSEKSNEMENNNDE